jgi:hypothetical protein
VIEISDEFKNNIKKKYNNKNRWQEIYKLFHFYGGQIERFLINNDNLIYYENFSNFRQYLYISKNLEKEIFRMIYNERDYINFYRVYDRIRASLYLYKLAKRLRTYIEHYFKYRIHQIFRHKFYKILKLIISPSISFYIICGDFVLKLSVTINGINTVFTFINKFIKRVKIISKRAI